MLPFCLKPDSDYCLDTARTDSLFSNSLILLWNYKQDSYLSSVFVLYVLQLRSSFKQAFSKKKTKSQSAPDEMEEMCDSLPSSPKLQHDNRQGSIATLRSSPSTTESVSTHRHTPAYNILPVVFCLGMQSLSHCVKHVKESHFNMSWNIILAIIEPP